MFVIRSSHCEYVRRRLCRCVRSCMFGITRAQHRHMRCVAVCGCFGDNDCCEPPPMTMCAPRTHDTSHKAHLSAYGAHSMVPYAIPNNEPSRVYTLRVCGASFFAMQCPCPCQRQQPNILFMPLLFVVACSVQILYLRFYVCRSKFAWLSDWRNSARPIAYIIYVRVHE